MGVLCFPGIEPPSETGPEEVDKEFHQETYSEPFMRWRFCQPYDRRKDESNNVLSGSASLGCDSGALFLAQTAILHVCHQMAHRLC
jgi:hypothetical protein